MPEQMNLYTILTAIIPGAIFLCVAAVLFPDATEPFRLSGLPDEFAVIVLIAASLLAGTILQTVGSFIEPLLFFIFGGRPSDRALKGKLGNRYLPKDASVRIKEKLKAHFSESASDRSLFLGAMNLAESTSDSKAAIFNAQYGQLRSLLTLFLVVLILLGASGIWGAAAEWSSEFYWTVFILCMLLLMLFAWRTRQRGAYYSREVLLTAERLLEKQSDANESTNNETKAQGV